jgi:aspartate/methionine/tyrosine aminotransferase
MSRLAQQHNALNLAEGLPDYDPLPWVSDAVAAALRQPLSQQSVDPNGLLVLRQAIAHWYGRHTPNAWQPCPDTQLTVTTGATEALLLGLLTQVQVGDGVLLLEPYYEPYAAMVQLAHGQPQAVANAFTPQGQLNWPALRQAVQANTKGLIVNSPCNPTGAVLSEADWQQLEAFVCHHGLWLISDEVYTEMTYTPELAQQARPAISRPALAQRCLSIHSTSKLLSATGWRVGWAVANPAWTQRLQGAHDVVTAGAPSVLQLAAATVLNQWQPQHSANLRASLTQKRAMALTLADRLGLSLASPAQGAYYLWLALPPTINDAEYCQHLITHHGLALVPGRTFFAASQHSVPLVRLCYGKQTTTLQQALQRIS